MGIWLKLGLAALALALIGGMIWSYNSTMTANGVLRTQLDSTQQALAALKLQADAADAKQSDLAKLVGDHSDAIAANSALWAKKQAYATRLYQGAADATRSILDFDLPQFRCLYEAGGCETSSVPDKPVGH